MNKGFKLDIVAAVCGQATDSQVRYIRDSKHLERFAEEISNGLGLGFEYHISGEGIEIAFMKPMPTSFIYWQLSCDIKL